MKNPMRGIALIILLSWMAMVRAQVFPVQVELTFNLGCMAKDAGECRQILEQAGLKELPPKGISVNIKSKSDCLNLEGNRPKIAAERASYCENFLRHEYAGTDLLIISETSTREDCDGATPDPIWRTVVIRFNKEEVAQAVELLREPEQAPQAIDSSSIDASLNTLSQLNVGESLVLDGLNFQPGKHRILNEAKPVLKKLLTIMQENPSLKIEIQGHICCGKKGGEDGVDEETGKYNLSWTRAQFVYDYLIDHGIDPSRLSYKGYAMSLPLVYPEKTIQDQIKNRRVEVLITGK